MSDANPTIGDPVENLLHLIGQAIEEDVETYEITNEYEMIIERDGRTFRVSCEAVET